MQESPHMTNWLVWRRVLEEERLGTLPVRASSDGTLRGKITPACWKSLRKIRSGLKDHSGSPTVCDGGTTVKFLKRAYNERPMAEYYKT